MKLPPQAPKASPSGLVIASSAVQPSARGVRNNADTTKVQIRIIAGLRFQLLLYMYLVI